jgi:hypothetical protein
MVCNFFTGIECFYTYLKKLLIELALVFDWGRHAWQQNIDFCKRINALAQKVCFKILASSSFFSLIFIIISISSVFNMDKVY